MDLPDWVKDIMNKFMGYFDPETYKIEVKKILIIDANDMELGYITSKIDKGDNQKP